MKLKDLKLCLYSPTGEIQRAIVYDYNQNKDLEQGCSVEYAISHYGEYEVKRISSCYEYISGQDYLVITI